MQKVKVGIVGCGNISNSYLTNAKNFPILDIVAVADIVLERAKEKAEAHGVPHAMTVKEILKNPDIQMIINLTIPKAHAQVALAAIKSGKSVINEKPLAVNREEGKAILAAAKAKKVRVGCAPDTFLGAGHQTARKLIDEGAIGRPVAATAFMMCPGHEGWHPNPEFFYEAGGGPMFDMGPYYVTDLLQLLGPVKRIMGSAKIVIPVRTIGSKPKAGKKIRVKTPDHIAGNMEFESGAVATIITSFATCNTRPSVPQPITIYGTEGTIMVPDPNGFDGIVKLWRKEAGGSDFIDVPPSHTTGYGRSVGAADMAKAILTKRDHRVSGERAYAVLDIMQGFIDSSDNGRAYNIKAKYTRPAPMPTGLPLGELD
jgi:predicted dehydrogenase